MAELTSAPVLVSADDHTWSADTRRLRNWFRVYIILCAAGFASTFVHLSVAMPWVAQLGFTGSVIIFICCLVFGYRVQSKLNRAHVSQTGAWVIIVAGWLNFVLLYKLGFTNGAWLVFWVLGIAVSRSILANANSITRRLSEGALILPSENETNGSSVP